MAVFVWSFLVIIAPFQFSASHQQSEGGKYKEEEKQNKADQHVLWKTLYEFGRDVLHVWYEREEAR